MKDIIEFLNEAKEFTSDTKVRIGDSAELLAYLKNEIDNVEGSIKVTGDGIKYNNILVPGTKLSLGLTAGEYADIFVDWLNEFEDKKSNASVKTKYKRLNKNIGVPRGNYGAAEKMAQRERERNNMVK